MTVTAIDTGGQMVSQAMETNIGFTVLTKTIRTVDKDGDGMPEFISTTVNLFEVIFI